MSAARSPRVRGLGLMHGLAWFALAVLLPPTALGQMRGVDHEMIASFHSDIAIGTDGSLAVTETLEVEARGQEIRRGILRDFPTDYRDRAGNRVTVPFEVLSVTRDGAAEAWRTEALANGVRVRIGKADVMLPNGRHRYEIRYRTARQVGFFDRHDELFWNVTGNGWTLMIGNATARVRLPAAVPASQLKAEAYRGPQGSSDAAVARASDGAADFDANGLLLPREGLTVVLSFPKGIVTPPGIAQRIGWFISANRAVGIGGLGTLLLGLALFLRWRQVGRDPPAAPLFPRYEPPAGLSAGAARFINRMGFDQRCFAAGVLNLGARGYLKVEQTGDRFTVQRTGRQVPWLAGDRPLADALFGGADRTVISKTYDPQIAKAQQQYRQALKQHYKGVMFTRNTGTMVAASIAGASILVLCQVSGAAPLVLFACAAVLLAMLVAFWRWMPAYSQQGRRLQDEIAGLRQYLGVAERDSLARMQAPELTPHEFARMLPYAMALDVEKTWADRFAAVAGAAAVAAAVDSYYHSDSLDGGSAAALGQSLGELGSTVSSASSPPGSSSGSDGGGSSGGGGGGGGGSGW